MKTKLFTLLTLALLITGQLSAAQRPPAKVLVAEAAIQPVSENIESLGTLNANESVDLTVTVTETISAIYFDDGERVKAGQLLVEMTSNEEQALLVEARATVAEARRQFTRIKSLSSQQKASESLLDERRRELETAQARLRAIESRLQDRQVKVPFDGVLGLRNISVGALVESGDVIATLDDDSQMKLDFSVPSRYLPLLKAGLPVVATSSAWPEREFSGKVKSIGSRVDPVSRTLHIRALLDNAERLLRPGMLMQVNLGTLERQGLLVPEECLVPLGDKQFVMVVGADNKVERRPVKIGMRKPGLVEILQGLSQGEKVITDGQLKVRVGATVKILAVEDGKQPIRELLNKSGSGNPQ